MSPLRRSRRPATLLMVAGAAVVASGLFGLGRSGLWAPMPGPPGGPCGERWGPALPIAVMPAHLREVSGFVSSPRHPGVAWMVRDSGNPASLYSFELAGGAARTREFAVAGADNGDWEDVAHTVGADGGGRLWILDNVNRHTSPKRIYEVEEPDPAGEGGARLVATYRWEYPDHGGNYDTETLTAVGGELVVVAKADTNRIYRFTTPLDPRRLNRPVFVGEVPEGTRLTFGSTSDDGRLFVTSSTRDDTVWVYRGLPGTGTADPPVFTRAMRPAQREAGDFFPAGGCDLVLVDERQVVWWLAHEGDPAGAAATPAPGPAPR